MPRSCNARTNYSSMETITAPARLRTLIDETPLLLVMFSASFCGPCKAVTPALNALTYMSNIKIVKVMCDVEDDDPMLRVVHDHGVARFPTFVLYVGGVRQPHPVVGCDFNVLLPSIAAAYPRAYAVPALPAAALSK